MGILGFKYGVLELSHLLFKVDSMQVFVASYTLTFTVAIMIIHYNITIFSLKISFFHCFVRGSSVQNFCTRVRVYILTRMHFSNS